MTPDTASSRAAMRAEVPTDRPSARLGRDGWGGSRDTSARQGETTALHSCYLPQRSINIHFATLIPHLINDVKAMTQQSLGAATTGACQFPFQWQGKISFHLSKLRNKSAHRERPY